jgi:UDP-N-acetylglucosamine 2-epimerase (non-hydrolysing)
MILIVLGTRAELIKMAPVMKELNARKMKYFFLHTGQHGINDLAKELGVRKPDLVLSKPSSVRGGFGVSKLKALVWGAKIFFKTRKAIKRIRPKMVLVHGDTMSTALASFAAKSLLARPLLAHVEAGLRSGDLQEPFPEEISRRVADFFSDYWFAPTELARENLLREGKKKERVFVTGNTSMDLLHEKVGEAASSREKIPRKPFLYAQLHRQENIKSRERLQAFCHVLLNAPCKVVLVLVENTRAQMEKFGLLKPITSSPRIIVKPALPYTDFLKVFSNAACVLTDGGGEIEEACALQIPCIVFRVASERQEAEKAGCALRTGCNPVKALDAIEDALAKRGVFKKISSAKNPFGSGDAGKKIVGCIEEITGGIIR